MGIPAKILDRVAKTVKSFFDIGTPFLTVQVVPEFRPFIGIPELFAGRGKHKLLLFIKGIQPGKIFSFKFIPEDAGWDKKLLSDTRILCSGVRPPPEIIQCICTW